MNEQEREHEEVEAARQKVRRIRATMFGPY